MTFKYFTREEFNCQETGENGMQDEFIHALDQLREACGFPFRITSGFRSPNHSLEIKKSKPGTHAQGIAADIAVSDGNQKFLIVQNGMALGFSGFGQGKTFMHVDTRRTRPVMWEYN
jgi:zinc D-Ala-D-Ala carboxypeptidase